MSQGRVQSKTALVTGGGSGIGFAVAKHLRQEGAEVVITDIREPDDCDGFTFMRHDIADEDAWQTVLDNTCRMLGGLDILVKSAGINGAG